MPRERSTSPSESARATVRTNASRAAAASGGATTMSPRTFKFNSRARLDQAGNVLRWNAVSLGPTGEVNLNVEFARPLERRGEFRQFFLASDAAQHIGAGDDPGHLVGLQGAEEVPGPLGRRVALGAEFIDVVLAEVLKAEFARGEHLLAPRRSSSRPRPGRCGDRAPRPRCARAPPRGSPRRARGVR